MGGEGSGRKDIVICLICERMRETISGAGVGDRCREWEEY